MRTPRRETPTHTALPRHPHPLQEKQSDETEAPRLAVSPVGMVAMVAAVRGMVVAMTVGSSSAYAAGSSQKTYLTFRGRNPH